MILKPWMYTALSVLFFVSAVCCFSFKPALSVSDYVYIFITTVGAICMLVLAIKSERYRS